MRVSIPFFTIWHLVAVVIFYKQIRNATTGARFPFLKLLTDWSRSSKIIDYLFLLYLTYTAVGFERYDYAPGVTHYTHQIVALQSDHRSKQWKQNVVSDSGELC